MHDPISDMLTRIRNAVLVNKNVVEVPYSKVKHQISKVLLDNKYINAVEVVGDKTTKSLKLVLFEENQNANITEIQRVSKPGRREYASVGKIPKIKNGRGIVVVSTSKGIVSGQQAIKNKVGGEILCSVY